MRLWVLRWKGPEIGTPWERPTGSGWSTRFCEAVRSRGVGDSIDSKGRGLRYTAGFCGLRADRQRDDVAHIF